MILTLVQKKKSQEEGLAEKHPVQKTGLFKKIMSDWAEAVICLVLKPDKTSSICFRVCHLFSKILGT